MIPNDQKCPKTAFWKNNFFHDFLHTSSNFLRLFSYSEKKNKVIAGFSMESSIYILALRFFGGLYKQQFRIEDNFSKIAITSVNFLRTLMNPEGKNNVISRFRMENTTYILALKFLIDIHTFPLSGKCQRAKLIRFYFVALEGVRRWCVDGVVGDDVPWSFLVKTREAWHVLKLVVRGGHPSS